MHTTYWRHGVIGLLAGLVCCPLLVVTLENVSLGVLLALLVGSAYAISFKPVPHAYIDRIMIAGTFGIILWAIVSVVLWPLVRGISPQWTAQGMRALFPGLIGWILYGASLGLLVQLCSDIVVRHWGEETQPTLPNYTVKTHILILGGGFGGVTTAEQLERKFGADPEVEFTLVSATNALLFTPMLSEVAASGLEPTHISSPLRTSLRRTNVVHGSVVKIDLIARHVYLAPDPRTAQQRILTYDQLVLALGSISNYPAQKSVARYALDFKTLVDAIRIRNHVLEMLERADGELDAEKRRALTTFVVAGGGFAGAELAGGLNDLVRGLLIYYPHITKEDVSIVLIHSRDRLLPELSASLATYALERMSARGVTFKLNERVEDALPGMVVLKSQEKIKTETLIWTAGVAPHPLLATLPVALDRRGAVIVDARLAVAKFAGLWALGDCAVVPDTKTGQPCPPTAQFALREAATLAHNIHASIRGGAQKTFQFDALGVLCVVGYQTACAEIMGRRFSGFLAWLMWRGIYLAKLPGLERKLYVLSSWVIELFFPPDSVQTLNIDSSDSNSEPQRIVTEPVEKEHVDIFSAEKFPQER